MTDLLLVRHGETEWHAENRYAGRSDVALTRTGRVQADALARWAATTPLDLVVCSPLQRSRRTAAPAAAAAGAQLVVEERLVEVDFGAGDGLTREEMAQRFPEDLRAFLAAPASHPLPGGETGADAVARAAPVLWGLRDAGHGRVLVVAHQTLLRLLLCELLGLPLDRYRGVFPRLGPAALTEVRLPEADGPPAALLRLNAEVPG